MSDLDRLKSLRNLICSPRATLGVLLLLLVPNLAFAEARPAADEVAANGGSQEAADTTGTKDSNNDEGDDDAPVADISEEIVVTGGLIEKSLQDTPESVAVWGSDTLTDANMDDLQDVFNQTANAYQVGNGEGFGIRGINHNSVGGGGSGELGSYYVDGVAFTGVSKRLGPQQLWDVDQIEILRGPQTTNVGRNALAGAVLKRTKNPVFRLESRLRFGFADSATWDVAGMVNTPVGQRSALRFTVENWSSDGFVTNPTRDEDDFDGRKDRTLRGKYLYESASPSAFQVIVSATYNENERGNDLVDLSRPDDRLNFSNLDDFEKHESFSFSANATWQMGENWSGRSITSYLDADYRRFDDDDQGPENETASLGRNSTDKNWAQDLRFEYTGEQARGVTGIYLTEVEIAGLTFGEAAILPSEVGIPAILQIFYPNPLFVGLQSPFDIETTNFAAYTHWDWEINERWSAFGGLRWDLEDENSDQTTTTTSLSELPDPSLFPPSIAGPLQVINAILLSQLGTTNSQTDTDYEALLPELGVKYEWNDRVVSSLFYKRGYRAGGAEFSLTGRLNEFDPEFLDTVELSVRASGADDRLTVNTNLYFGDWTDQQVSVQQSNNAFDIITENAGESEIHGFEVDFTYRPPAAWDIYGSLGYAYTEFTEFETAVQGDLSGNRFIGAPEWTAAFGANYRFSDGWFVHGDVNYKGDAFSSVDNNPDLKLEDRTLLNFRVGYETGSFSVYGYVNNATDETYAVSAFRNIDGRLLGKVGNPRQAGMQLVLRY